MFPTITDAIENEGIHDKADKKGNYDFSDFIVKKDCNK